MKYVVSCTFTIEAEDEDSAFAKAHQIVSDNSIDGGYSQVDCVVLREVDEE